MDVKGIISSCNVQQFYSEVLQRKGGGNYFCPFHEDRTASLSIMESGYWKCFNPACDGHKGGDALEMYRLLNPSMSFNDAIKSFSEKYGSGVKRKKKRKKVSNKLAGIPLDKKIQHERVALIDARKAHESLIDNSEAKELIRKKYGINEETILKYNLGYSKGRMFIPIINTKGDICNIKRHAVTEAQKKYGKTIQVKGHGGTYLFPISNVKNTRSVCIFAGEPDTLLALQIGINAVTWTSGEGSFNPELLSLFKGKEVLICYDIDEAGKDGAMRLAYTLASFVKSLSIVNLPVTVNDKAMPKHGDFCDYIRLGGTWEEVLTSYTVLYTSKELESLRDKIREEYSGDSSSLNEVKDKPSARLALAQIEEAKEVDITEFNQIVSQENYGNVIKFNCIVAGTSDTPWFYQSHADFFCLNEPGTKIPKCNVEPIAECISCVLSKYKGEYTYELDEDDIIETIGIGNRSRKKYLKDQVPIYWKCTHARMADKKRSKYIDNILSIYMIPDTDSFDPESENTFEYKVYQAYIVGQHTVHVNHRYEMIGRVISDPKTSQATMLITKATPMQSSFHSYRMNHEDYQKVIGAIGAQEHESVKQRIDRRIRDLRENVTNIYERDGLHLACDLLWHSPIKFNLLGKYNKKVSPEIAIIGDTRQGKSAVAEEYISHFSIGRYINCEGATAVGLIGGKDITGSKGYFVWGALTTSHRGLVVLDEADGLQYNDLAKLTGVRSRGIAQRTIAGGDRSTICHIRILWITNPRDNKPLAAHQSGYDAIKEFFGTEQDIARLDTAIIVQSKNIDSNRRPLKVPHRYTSEICQIILKWAWNLIPSHIIWDEGVEELILKKSDELSNEFGKMALVPANEMRFKIARLSISCAILCFSTQHSINGNGEDTYKCLVKKDHVEYICSFLKHNYSQHEFGYKYYASRHEQMLVSEDDFVGTEEFARYLRRLDTKVLKFIMNSSMLRFSDMQMIAPENPHAFAKRMTIEYGAMIRRREYYIKVPGVREFIQDVLDGKHTPGFYKEEEDKFFS